MPTRNDMYLLSTDTTFQQRVQGSLMASCIQIANEGYAIPFHRERATFVTTILANPRGTSNNWVQLFANTVSTSSNVINNATSSGTVTLTTSNVATQALLVLDTDIDAAISSEFNAFIRVPSN